MMRVRGEDRWKHFGTVQRPVEELGAKELEEHEQAVTLYRETYREQEPRHVARYCS